MGKTAPDIDVLLVGGGHNGLVCAAYLARAGLKVTVLERRGVVGGAAVTEQFHPGFRNSVASYTVSLLQPKVIEDLDLHRHGLRIVLRKRNNFLPLPVESGGGYLLTGGGRTAEEVAKFSPRDAAALPAYEARLDAIADVLRALALQPPPNVTDGGWWKALPELLRGARLGRRLHALDETLRQELLDLFTISAAEYLDRWFESAPLKALFGFDGIVGNYASPYAPGSAYVLLHHVFGEVNGKAGAWGHAIGGMGAITQAMRKECEARGVAIETEAEVAQLLVEGGKAVGVALADGRELRAATIASNLNPKLLYTKLVEPGQLDDDTAQRIRRYRCGSGTFRMNVALSELPDFTAMPGTRLQPHHQSGILVGPSLQYFEQAYFDARSRAHNPGWARKPIVEVVISSTLDDTLAPPGAHVASLFCQHVAPQLPGGRSWDDHRDEVADLMIATVDRHAPGFAASVLGRQALSPLDLEREFGLVGGDIFHGALSLNQLFSARPMLGQADYRGAIPGLYLCGAGTHPGGGVTGAPGHNAAQVLIADLG